jgi:hypothetical protein
MTMRALALLTTALLFGCGSDDPAPPIFGGFTPQDGAAVIFAPTECTISGFGTVSLSGVGLGFADYVGVCDVLTQTEFCGTRESSAAVLGVALSGRIDGAVDPAGPGTYPFRSSPPTTEAFLAALGDAAEVGLACEAVTELDASGGSIVLASVSGEAVSGTMDLRFDDGSVFEHDFDVAVCPISIDLCGLFQPCFDYVCVEAPP